MPKTSIHFGLLKKRDFLIRFASYKNNAVGIAMPTDFSNAGKLIK